MSTICSATSSRLARMQSLRARSAGNTLRAISIHALQPLLRDLVPPCQRFRYRRRSHSRRHEIDDFLWRDISLLAAEEAFHPGDGGQSSFRVEALLHVDPFLIPAQRAGAQ